MKKVHNKGKNEIKLSVTGFSGTKLQLIQWLERQDGALKKKFSVRENGDAFIVTTGFQNVADIIVGYDGNIIGQDPVRIERIGEEGRVSLKQICSELVSKYYRMSEASIYLDDIATLMKELGWTKPADSTTYSKMFELIANEKPAIKGIHFRNNSISTLLAFKQLYRLFPQLNSLDLENNQIKSIDQLDHIKEIPLEVLILTGNPITQDPNYQFQIRTLFKNMKSLDKGILGSCFKFPVTIQQNMPLVRIGFFQQYQDYKTIEDFLRHFFMSHDKNPAELNQYYMQTSLFSLTLSDNVASQLALSNRNHSMHLAQREYENRMYVGSKIVPFITNKFKTDHDMKDIAFDAYRVQLSGGGVINIIAYGKVKFNERLINFYRTMLLLINQGSAVIINDHLHLFKGEPSFIVVKQTNDVVNSVNNIKMKPELQGCFSEDEILDCLKLGECNYDEQKAFEFLGLLKKLVEFGFQKDEAKLIAVKLKWNWQFVMDGLKRYGKDLVNVVRQIPQN